VFCTLGAQTLLEGDRRILPYRLGEGLSFRGVRGELGLGASRPRVGTIRAIGVDEIQYSKGHKYLNPGRPARAGRYAAALDWQGAHRRDLSEVLHHDRREPRPGSKVSQGLRDSFWLQAPLCGHKAAYDCIKAFSETDFTEDLKKIDVPTLILHGDDDQIVPISDSALLSPKLVKGATLKLFRVRRTACARR
jgi:pimeloyl-ACP methyl ester carboxylesterase